MLVTIEYCVISNYEPVAIGLAAELRKAFPYAELQLTQSSGAVFEVVVEGRLIFSKKELGRLAEPGEVVKLIGRR